MDDFSFLHQNDGQDLVENMSKTIDESPIETNFKSFSNGTKLGFVRKGERGDRIGFQFASNGSVGLDQDFRKIQDFGKMNGTGQLYRVVSGKSIEDVKDSFIFDGKFVNGELKNGTMWGPNQEGKVVIKENEKIEKKLRELRKKEKENEE